VYLITEMILRRRSARWSHPFSEIVEADRSDDELVAEAKNTQERERSSFPLLWSGKDDRSLSCATFGEIGASSFFTAGRRGEK
jgi:hypothetical protein